MKKYKFIFIYIFIVIIYIDSSFAQLGFQKKYGTKMQDNSTAILPIDNNQSIILVGSLIKTKDSTFIEVIKIDSCLNKVFAKKIYKFGKEILYSVNSGIGLIKQTANGNLVLAASTSLLGTPGSGESLLINMKTDGTINWAKTYSNYHKGGCLSMDINQNTGDIYMLCQSSITFGQFIIKADSIGNLIWAKMSYTPKRMQGVQLITTSDNHFIVIGNATNSNAFITKYDSTGKVIWNNFLPSLDSLSNINNRYNIFANCLELDSNIIISGSTQDFGVDGYLLSMNSLTGIVQWKKSYKWKFNISLYPLIPKAILKNKNKSIQIYGYVNANEMLFKTDAIGNAHWAYNYTGSIGSYFKSLAHAPQNGHYLTGYVNDRFGTTDFQLIKVDSVGKTACAYEELDIVTIDRPWKVDTTVQILDSNTQVIVTPITLKSEDIAIYQRTLCTTQEPFAGIGSAVDQDTIFVCDTTSYTIVNSNNNPNSKYYWNTGDTSRSITVNQTGRYVLRIVKGACESVDSVYIIIAPVYHSSLAKDTSSYAGCQVLLNATPKKNHPGSITKYIWNTIDTTQTILASQTGKYKVTIYNQWNCAVSDSIYIHFDTLKLFPLIKNMTICDTTFFTIYSNADTIKPKTILWNTGATTSNISVTQTGNYILTIEKNSCKASDSMQVNIAYQGIRNLPKDTLICPNQTFILDAKPKNINTNYRLQYLWNTVDTIASVPITKDGLYTCKITNPFGCVLIDSCYIKISDTLKVQIRKDTLICPNTAINLWSIVTGGDSSTYQFAWYNSANQKVSNTKNFTLFNLSQSQKFIFEITEKCGIKRDSVYIKVREPLVYSFNQPLHICKGDTAHLINIDPSIDSLAYSFSWKNNILTGKSIFVTPSISSVYKVKLIDHCTNNIDTLSNLVNVVSPKALFTATPQITDIYNPCILFKNQTTQADSTHFYFGFNNSIWNFDTITYCYPDTGMYFSQLIATNSYGCLDTFKSYIFIKDVYTAYIPNAFTPNKDNPLLNETFFPVCSNCESWELSIYNIWGENIYHSENKNGSSGWDGTYKEQNCPNGLYLYTLKIKDKQGEIHDHYQGTVMLMR